MDVTVKSKYSLVSALESARYIKENEEVIIRNGEFIITLRPISTAGAWMNCVTKAREKALAKLINSVRKQPAELFKVE